MSERARTQGRFLGSRCQASCAGLLLDTVHGPHDASSVTLQAEVMQSWGYIVCMISFLGDCAALPEYPLMAELPSISNLQSVADCMPQCGLQTNT